MSIPRAQLWLGDKELLYAEFERYIKAFFLSLPSGSVYRAGLPSLQVHPLVRWLQPPEKGGYKRGDFEFLMNEVQRERAPHEPLVIVIEEAQRLNDSCANALLKILEEPIEGIFFLLGAPARDLVVPTIVSRTCLLDKRIPLCSATKVPLIECLCTLQPPTFEVFMGALEVTEVDEANSGLLLDQLIVRWHEIQRQALLEGDRAASVRGDLALRILIRCKERLPMPGSARFFWRNLFMLFST